MFEKQSDVVMLITFRCRLIFHARSGAIHRAVPANFARPVPRMQ